jgi:lysophosphatidate acyltransferase
VLTFQNYKYYFPDIWPVMNKTTVVAKRELLYIFPFGLCAYLCGLVFIDRYAVDKAKNTLNTAMEGLKRNNIKLWVFPEGE